MVIENCPFQRDPRVRKEAATLSSSGYLVSVICPSVSPSQPFHQVVNGVNVYAYPPIVASSVIGYCVEYAYATLAIFALCLLVLVRDGFEVIHLANPPDTQIFTVLPFRWIGKRVIYDQHDICPELLLAKFPHLRWLFPIFVRFERWSYRLADHVITANESYRRNALARGRIPNGKISVVRNGPDTLCINSSGMNNDLLSKSNNLIVYTGTIGTQDGVDGLCRILKLLRFELKHEDFFCVVVGDGDALPRIKESAREMHLDDKMDFVGWISDPTEYTRYLNTAQICVSPEPATAYDNCSTFIKIMDYMAAGKPIVAFDLAESRYSAADSALYAAGGDEFKFAVCLKQLMDSPSLRAKLGERGRNRVREHLGWEHSAERLLQAYRACLELG